MKILDMSLLEDCALKKKLEKHKEHLEVLAVRVDTCKDMIKLKCHVEGFQNAISEMANSVGQVVETVNEQQFLLETLIHSIMEMSHNGDTSTKRAIIAMIEQMEEHFRVRLDKVEKKVRKSSDASWTETPNEGENFVSKEPGSQLLVSSEEPSNSASRNRANQSYTDNSTDDNNYSQLVLDAKKCLYLELLSLQDSIMQECNKHVFTTFDPITKSEFAEIPSYVIGRKLLKDLNDFLGSVEEVIENKYKMVSLGKMGARKKGEFEKFLYHVNQAFLVYKETGVKDCRFFTAEDYYNHKKEKLSKSKLDLMTALRLCKRLKFVKSSKTLFYVVHFQEPEIPKEPIKIKSPGTKSKHKQIRRWK